MMSFFYSFVYAIKGLLKAIRGERNLRFHLVAACYAVWMAVVFRLETTELILLVLTIALVISLELVNTAIELSWQNPSTENYEKAGAAKDVAAAAVLCSAIGAAVVGILLFFDLQKLSEITATLLSNPIYSVLFATSIVISFLFVFKFKER